MRRSTLLLSLTVVSGLLSVALFLPSRSEATWDPWSKCVSTGPQCDTDNGTQFRLVCPEGYFINQADKCVKKIYEERPYEWKFNGWYYYKDYKSCEQGWSISSGDYTRCERFDEKDMIKEEQSCHTGVIQNDACEVTPVPEEPAEPTSVPEAPSEPQVDNGYSGYRSSLNSDRVQCGNSTFDAVMDLKHEGYPAKDIKVRFTFNDQVKEISTNKDGRAKIDFDMAEGTVYAKAPDYPEQAMHISLPKDCPMPEQKIEQLANTGKQNELFVAGGMLIGLAGSIAAIYAYKKNQKVA
jgi:LPXTG-motif cell wall-anchored protein